MFIEDELKQLTQKIGSDELLDRILVTYQKEMLLKEIGVLRYSFCLDYRYALDIVGEAGLLGIAKIPGKVFRSERIGIWHK